MFSMEVVTRVGHSRFLRNWSLWILEQVDMCCGHYLWLELDWILMKTTLQVFVHGWSFNHVRFTPSTAPSEATFLHSHSTRCLRSEFISGSRDQWYVWSVCTHSSLSKEWSTGWASDHGRSKRTKHSKWRPRDRKTWLVNLGDDVHVGTFRGVIQLWLLDLAKCKLLFLYSEFLWLMAWRSSVQYVESRKSTLIRCGGMWRSNGKVFITAWHVRERCAIYIQTLIF